MKSLSQKDTPPDFLSSHPSLEVRIERILKYEVEEDFTERPLQFPWSKFMDSLKEK